MSKIPNQNTRQSAAKVRDRISQAPKNTLRSIVLGGVLSSDFFFKHKLTIFMTVLLLIFYIATKYQCMTGMENIQKYKKELEIVKAERARESSEYMSRIRESSMAHIADSIRPGLRVQQQPPYVLELKK